MFLDVSVKIRADLDCRYTAPVLVPTGQIGHGKNIQHGKNVSETERKGQKHQYRVRTKKSF